MTKRIQEGGLQVAASLHDFITAEALPGTGVSAATFWSALDSIVHDLAPVNRSLLQKREDLQTQIDAWLRDRKGQALDAAAYRAFLVEIGYLLPEGADFSADTPETDPEIASIAGPQLVVPVMNARYALNAANARWGSLYDALYGTDAISEDDGATRSGGFNPARGAKVIAFARDILNRAVPLAAGSHGDAAAYSVADGALVVALQDGKTTTLKDAAAFAGYLGDPAEPDSVLFVHNGLHIEVCIDRSHFIGKDDPAGVSDVVMEAAVTTIHGLRGFRCRRGCRGQGAGLPQLAGPDEGRSADRFDKGGRWSSAG